MSEGIFGVALGSALGAIVGGLSTIAYPDNIGMLRTTRVDSRYATLAAGILLIALGGIIKFDMLIVLVPQPVVSAAATLLFGIVFMHGVQMLATVDWDERKFIVAGLALAHWPRRNVCLAASAWRHAAAGQAVRSAAGHLGRPHARRVALCIVSEGFRRKGLHWDNPLIFLPGMTDKS